MFSKVYSAGLQGIDGYPVQVEADVGNGLPGFYMVGYLASEVREAAERVKTALKNSGFPMQPRKITVNLSPADIRKDGTAFDLPVAVAVLTAYGIGKPSVLEGSAFIGELGLDGRIKPVRGVLSLVSALRDAGRRRCFLPKENVPEGMAVGQIEIVSVEHMEQMMEFLKKPEKIAREHFFYRDFLEDQEEDVVDFSEVNGQRLVRRATEVAAAGRHNILYLGPPGSGKSMAARRLPTIMSAMSPEEQLEVSKVYSVCGMLPAGKALLHKRPFRAPHHTISPQAMAGGGKYPKPGEISLASRGVLFLDEFPEFRREALEILRQPLEERKVTVSRVHGSCVFPANVLLAAAMNVETVILIQAAYDKKTEMPQNQGILLIFFVIKVTIKDNWSYFQIKKKGESAPVFNDRKVIVIKMYLSLQGKISIGVAVTSTKQYIFAIRRGPKYKI